MNGRRQYRLFKTPPHWITVKWSGVCAACSNGIKQGEQAWYWPSSREMYCSRPNCGQKAAADFNAAKQDQDFLLSQMIGTPIL